MVPENSNYNGINPVGMNKNTNNPNYQIAAGSLQSTVPTNQYLKPIKSNQDIFNSNVRNSCVSLALMRIPCLEWKNNVNKGTKTVEYYLNVFYNKKKNNLSLNDPSRTKIKNSSISYKDDDNLTNIEDLPFKQKEHILSSGEEDKIIKILKNQIVFQGVSPEILSVIASEILILTIPEGKIIYDISDDGNFFYIIGKGKVVVNIQDNDNNVLGQWSTFGEISLFTEKKREEVIISKEPCELYTIDGESFRDIQKRNNEMVLKERYNFLNNIALFESLDKISKYNVAQKLKKKEFHSNNKIITKGEKGDKLYIIKEGIVSCRIGLQEIRRLSNNEYFGQNAILIDVKRGADIIALNKTVCYEISKDDLKEALTEDYI
jgi:cAMP-dependent protein kinase regulator